MAERSGKEWRGSPLDMGSGMDPNGIKEIVVVYDTGNKDVLKPKLREEYGSYELQQAAVYVRTLANQLHRNANISL